MKDKNGLILSVQDDVQTPQGDGKIVEFDTDNHVKVSLNTFHDVVKRWYKNNEIKKL